MNECMNAEVRDALPDLMHGRLSDLDTVTMRAHVETCADCREELRLLEEIRASAPIAPRVDVARIVAALPVPIPTVVDQLVVSAPARVRRQSSMPWKMTAVAALLVAGSLTFATSRRQAPVTPVASTPVAAPMTSGSVAETAGAIAVVAGAPDKVVAIAHTTKTSTGFSLTGGVQDLSDDQLESLVNSLDNVEALPSGEPEPLTISVDEDGLQ